MGSDPYDFKSLQRVITYIFVSFVIDDKRRIVVKVRKKKRFEKLLVVILRVQTAFPKCTRKSYQQRRGKKN